jgi:hypothetical protein
MMPEAVTQSTIDALAQNFRQFAEIHCKGSSPLYERLSLSIASDEALLRLAAQVPPGQPVPNLLFGAVHYLLYQQSDHALARYYPSIVNSPQPIKDAFPFFRQFCLSKRTIIVDLLHTRRVQTNEVRRCAFLFPAFNRVFELGHGMPLSLIEIGTSAGLNLLWDYYQYDYDTGTVRSRENTKVILYSTFRGDTRPHLPTALAPVEERIGIDLNIIDVREANDALWLKALIWPEQQERTTLLANAIEVVQAHLPTLLTGDGITLLPEILTQLRADTSACIFHTFTLNQVAPEARLQLANLLTKFSLQRPIYRIGCEWLGTEHPQLTLTRYHLGQQTETLLAHCDFHGRWIEWLAS